jgi:hypothetical protein
MKRLFVTLPGVICQDQQPRRAKKVKLVLEDILVSRDTKAVILACTMFVSRRLIFLKHRFYGD